MKTSTLTGADLNRAVAMALGLELDARSHLRDVYWKDTEDGVDAFLIPDYAGDVSQAWPILEKMLPSFAYNQLGLFCQIDVSLISATHQLPRRVIRMHGSTLLEAALRCFVASKLGDEVELP